MASLAQASEAEGEPHSHQVCRWAYGLCAMALSKCDKNADGGATCLHLNNWGLNIYAPMGVRQTKDACKQTQ